MTKSRKGYAQHRHQRGQAAAQHATTPAQGGSVTRRYLRGNMSAARDTHTPRRHGMFGGSRSV